MIRTISVITVAFNSGMDMIPTMESVLAQDLTGIGLEYWVIDGASTDGTVDLARSYCRRMQERGIQYQVISEPDSGIYDAMNKGIRLAGGELIGFLNSGDWYEPGALQKVMETFARKQCGMMFGSVRIYKQNGSSFVKRARQRRFQTSRDWNHPAMFVKSSLYKKYPFPNQGIHDDYAFYLKMRTLPVKIVTTGQVLANFRMGGASNQKGIKKMCRRVYDRYRYCYRANGYSRWYFIECIVTEAAKWLFG